LKARPASTKLRPRRRTAEPTPGRQAGALLLAVVILLAEAARAGNLAGLRLDEALARLQGEGVRIVFSSALVEPWMRIGQEPASTEPRAVAAEILAPFGLAVEDGPGGTLLVVRGTAPAAVAGATPGTPVAGADAPLEEIVVNASRYEFSMLAMAPPRLFDPADLEVIPDVGDDPVRAVARLPGTAGGALSAKTSVRGGEFDETLLRFDGLRIFDPFHFKDFQSLFSVIDPAVMQSMEVYTGGFPVTYGDRMSAVIDIEPLAPVDVPSREIAVSFFNASARAADSFNDGRGDWLASARRSNMDLIMNVVDPTRGEPTYNEFYGRLGHRLTDELSLHGSLLLLNDDIDVADTDEEELATATYHDRYFWLRLDYRPPGLSGSSDGVSGSLLVARSEIDGHRQGTADQPGVATGALAEDYSATVNSIQADWTWRSGGGLAVDLGGELRDMEGRFDYHDEVQFDVLFLVPGAPTEAERTRDLSASPHGREYGLYANLRLEDLGRWSAEAGLRWDRETLSPDHDAQVSPRAGLLYRLGERTRLRASWGRFFQSQAINELQIADGVTEFEPAQRADHWVGSLEHRTERELALRAEVFRKKYSRLRPRYENLLDSFILLPEIKPDRIRIAPDSALAHGFELSLGRQGDAPFGWWLSYTWSSVRDEEAGMRTPRSWDQTNALNAGAAWRNERWELSLAAMYRTGWPTTDAFLVSAGDPSTADTGPRNGERLRPYFTLDARAARKFAFERAGNLTVFAEVANLTNRRNDCCIEYDVETEEGEPFLDLGRVDYLLIFPSLGFIWRF
jgi:outer membrane receptor protein involved in Fe transport